MLKRRRHAVNLGFSETVPRGFVAPLRDGVANLFLRLCGLCLRPDRNTSPPPIARASDAVLSSSLIAVVRMRGLMPVGTDFRSYACDRRQALLRRIEKTMVAKVSSVLEITIVNTSRRQSASISAFGSGTMLPQRVDNFQITAALVVHCAGHAHGREERDAPFALPVKAPEQDHRLLCTVSTRLSGTAMPAFAASARATASHATVLISSSRRARKAAPAVRPEAEYAWRLPGAGTARPRVRQNAARPGAPHRPLSSR